MIVRSKSSLKWSVLKQLAFAQWQGRACFSRIAQPRLRLSCKQNGCWAADNKQKAEDMNPRMKRNVLIISLAFISALSTAYALALDKRRPEHFLPEERRIISEYYRRANTSKKGLPPGLAKRGGKLPPGLQKHLEKNGQLP